VHNKKEEKKGEASAAVQARAAVSRYPLVVPSPQHKGFAHLYSYRYYRGWQQLQCMQVNPFN
jgi:hypothetical protein